MRNKVAGVPGLDPTIPVSKLEIDGVTYTLCFDFNALAQHEQETGQSLYNHLTFGGTIKSVRSLLYVGLLKAHPDMTLDRAGKMLRGNWAPILVAISEAWTASQPDASNEVDKQAPKD